MKKFTYKAFDKEFEVIKGTVEEDELSNAKEKLRGEGLNVISISESKSISDLSIFKKKLKDAELSGFCGQLAIILDAGVNILKGLEVMEAQMKDKNMRKIIGNIHTSVKRGNMLGKAMEATGAFPELLHDMVTSGELSGNMDSMLFNMETYYEREANIKNKVKAASVYPIMLLGSAVGMIVFFNFFIFPEIKDLFADAASLPFITKVLIGSLGYLNSHPIQILISIVAFVLFFRYLFSLKTMRYWQDGITLKMPAIGPVKRDIIIARFSRSMALFLKSAVPILSIIDSLKLIVDNFYIAEKLEKVRDDMVNGSTIADAFEAQGVFEPMVIQMMKVGEETGKLDDSLYKLAEIYDKKAEIGITKLMAMIEPAFTLVVGVFVAVIILAMAMPIMNMTSTLK
ncbi:MAG TPA: type II secretion system F family protein [Clostridium sp.]|uniref:type II secretion system F family protein n=1 Tax=Clostridium sp. TaxID=1506 RepID=UPI002F95E262